MKKGLIFMSILPLAAFAKIQTVEVTPEIIKNYEQIVDIRTLAEWEDSGIIDGAKTVTFDSRDKQRFLEELSKSVDLKKPVALICRSGRRSAAAAAAIDAPELNIINLDGGMSRLIDQGYKTVHYKK